MLTLAKLHSESVAYYESTVDNGGGVESYYSEDGRQPARAWVVSVLADAEPVLERIYGVKSGQVVVGKDVSRWFYHGEAPGGERLGRAPGSRGLPGYDVTLCAPKSVSVLWGLSDDARVRAAVDTAHEKAVVTALRYVELHAGYTRRADPINPKRMIVEGLFGLSGVRYEHRTSRAGDPHVHSHVLVNNKQRSVDGKFRTIDGVSLYHEARAAGMVYQAQLRAELSASLGVEWGEVTNGCAEIVGLDDAEVLDGFSTRRREIDAWREAHGIGSDGERNPVVDAALSRVGQKKTRQTKDVDTPIEQLREQWVASPAGRKAKRFIDRVSVDSAHSQDAEMPTVAQVVDAVIAERSTFTRADLCEAAAALVPSGVAGEVLYDRLEDLVDEVMATGAAWSVTPEKDRDVDLRMREGSQRFTAEPVVEEVNRGIDLATAEVHRGVDASMIQPIEGRLSVDQARAMRTVVASEFLASVVVAPAGAGKTSSLKAARRAWEMAGKTVVGLAPTGKAADVMVGEAVAHESSTIARVLHHTDGMSAAEIAAHVGWGDDTVVVVDEAGMVGNHDAVRILEVASAAGARVVFVGDPHQYSPVKARSGLLGTLAYELPDAVELTEVFRQHDPVERRVSKWLRDGDQALVEQAARWYADQGRLHAGSITAMLGDAMAGWKADVGSGVDAVLVAGDRDTVDALNRAAQKHLVDTGVVNVRGRCVRLNAGGVNQHGGVGDVVLTRQNDYGLVTTTGVPVRNGQRWIIESIDRRGDVHLRRVGDDQSTVVVPAEYLSEHGQLGYATTGHAAQGMTVDVARVVADAGRVDRAGVYVPMTRGRTNNELYLVERDPMDVDTAHGTTRRGGSYRASVDDSRELLVAACYRQRTDVAPHQLWRDAYREWSLERMSTATLVQSDPFAGTRMAEVMQHRHHMRVERMQRWADTQDHPLVRDKDARPLWVLSNTQLMWGIRKPNEVAAALDHARSELTKAEDINQRWDQVDVLDHQLGQLRGRRDSLRRQAGEVFREREALRQQEASRGVWSKMFGSSQRERQIEQFTQQLRMIDGEQGQVAGQITQVEQDCRKLRYKLGDTRKDVGVVARRVELLEALADPSVAQAERRDRVRAGNAGTLEAERQEAAGVFADLEATGVWGDMTTRHSGGYVVPSQAPAGYDVMPMGTRRQRPKSQQFSWAPDSYRELMQQTFPVPVEEYLKTLENGGGSQPEKPFSSGMGTPGFDMGSGTDNGLDM